MNSNVVSTKKVNKLSILHLTFLPSEFIETALVTFVDIVFVTFVDTLSVTFIISSQANTELSTVLFKCLLFPQAHMLVF